MIEKIELLESRDGYKITSFVKDSRTFLVGSLYSEKREIARFLDSVGNVEKNDTYIVFGMGGLNHVRELINNKFDSSKILIIECYQECVELVNRSTDQEMRVILNHPDVFVASEMEAVKLFLRNHITPSNINKLKVLSYSGYTRFFKDEIQPYYKLVVEYGIEVKANNFTLSMFEDDWYRNSVRSLRYLNETRTLSPYRGICVGKPAIIVSAGPSLEKNIALLTQNRDAVVISGGRTLKSLLNIGVDPDFLTIIDASSLSYELVERHIALTKARLVYYFGVPPEMLAAHKGEKITFHQDNVMCKFLQEDMIHLMAGGSVAHAMTMLAIELGCDPIVFIGQDLAYTNDMEHSQVASSPWRGDEVSLTPEEIRRSMLTQDIYGRKVKTCTELDLYRRQLERIIESNKDKTFLNCTEGGVNIEGSETVPLESFYSQLPCGRSLIPICNTMSKKLDPLRILEDNKKHMIGALDQYAKAVEICDRYLRLIEKHTLNLREVDDDLNRIEVTIRSTNRKILFIDSMINKILDRINNSSEYVVFKTDSETESLLKNLKKSRYLYLSISEKLGENIKIVDEEVLALTSSVYTKRGKSFVRELESTIGTREVEALRNEVAMPEEELLFDNIASISKAPATVGKIGSKNVEALHLESWSDNIFNWEALRDLMDVYRQLNYEDVNETYESIKDIIGKEQYLSSDSLKHTSRAICGAKGFFRLGYVVREKASEVAYRRLSGKAYQISDIFEGFKASMDKSDFVTSRVLMGELEKANISRKLRNDINFFYCLTSGDVEGLDKIAVEKRELHDRPYFNCINSKSIAIVGPAPSETDNSEEIDSYDVVIRCAYKGKDAIPSAGFGNKTSISYYNIENALAYAGSINLGFFNDLDYSVFKSIDYVYQRKMRDAKKGRAGFFSDHMAFSGHFNMLPIILFDIFHFKPKSVKVFNNNFFLSDTSYHEGYLTLRDLGVKERWSSFANHDLISQVRFVRNIWKSQILEVDKDCEAVLRLSDWDYIKGIEETYVKTYYGAR